MLSDTSSGNPAASFRSTILSVSYTTSGIISRLWEQYVFWGIGPKLRELVSLSVEELCVRLKVWRNNRADLADYFIQVCSLSCLYVISFHPN